MGPAHNITGFQVGLPVWFAGVWVQMTDLTALLADGGPTSPHFTYWPPRIMHVPLTQQDFQLTFVLISNNTTNCIQRHNDWTFTDRINSARRTSLCQPSGPIHGFNYGLQMLRLRVFLGSLSRLSFFTFFIFFYQFLSPPSPTAARWPHVESGQG